MTDSQAAAKGQPLVHPKVGLQVQPDVLGNGSHFFHILIPVAQARCITASSVLLTVTKRVSD